MRCITTTQIVCNLAQVIAPLYAKVLEQAARTLGAGPAFAALWPAGAFRAPWDLAVRHLYEEVALRCCFRLKSFSYTCLQLHSFDPLLAACWRLTYHLTPNMAR